MSLKSYLTGCILAFVSTISFSQGWMTQEAGNGIKPDITCSSDGTVYIPFLKEDSFNGFMKMATISGGSVSEAVITSGYPASPLHTS